MYPPFHTNEKHSTVLEPNSVSQPPECHTVQDTHGNEILFYFLGDTKDEVH